MTGNPRKRLRLQVAKSPPPARKSVSYAVVAAGLAAVCLFGYQAWKKRQGAVLPRSEAASASTANQDNALPAVPLTQASEMDEVQEVAPQDTLPAPGVPTVVESVNRHATTAQASPPQALRTEPTPYLRQLVASLTQIDLTNGALTPAQADQWRHGLQQLIQQGSEAVPAIRDFLEQNQDWNLGAGNPLGYRSLRAGLLDALEQIGGPDAQALMLQTLQTTAVPSEIARLARYLEQQAPGQFRQETGAAIRETLAQAASGQLRGWDVGPLFQVLQSYGDANAVADLENSASKWSYYSMLALANVPLGEGIPSLIRLAQESPGIGARGVALEMLAQVAVQNREAEAALVELVGSGKFSDKNWLRAIGALGGERYFITDTGLDNATIPIGSGVRTFHLEASNQNFYSAPAWGGMSSEQINQRVAIIDQLLAMSPSAAVAQVLQNTRASLLTKGQQASAN